MVEGISAKRHSRRFTQPAHEYVDHLSTISYYLQLAEPERGEAFAAILEALPAEVEINADLFLHLARRTTAT